MQQPESNHVLQLLVKVYNRTITDYYYFPEIIFAGAQKIERADFDFLLAEGYIHKQKFDSFGRYFVLSKKGETAMHHQLSLKHHRRKTTAVPLNQGCLYFSRQNIRQASGARCLLFF